MATQPGGCEGGFDAGVTRAENDYIVGLWIDKHGKSSTWNIAAVLSPQPMMPTEGQGSNHDSERKVPWSPLAMRNWAACGLITSPAAGLLTSGRRALGAPNVSAEREANEDRTAHSATAIRTTSQNDQSHGREIPNRHGKLDDNRSSSGTTKTAPKKPNN